MTGVISRQLAGVALPPRILTRDRLYWSANVSTATVAGSLQSTRSECHGLTALVAQNCIALVDLRDSYSPQRRTADRDGASPLATAGNLSPERANHTRRCEFRCSADCGRGTAVREASDATLYVDHELTARHGVFRRRAATLSSLYREPIYRNILVRARGLSRGDGWNTSSWRTTPTARRSGSGWITQAGARCAAIASLDPARPGS